MPNKILKTIALLALIFAFSSCASLPSPSVSSPTLTNSMSFFGTADQAKAVTFNAFKKLKIEYKDGLVETGVITGRRATTWTEGPYIVGVYFKKISENQYDIWVIDKYESAISLVGSNHAPTILLNIRHSAAELGDPGNQNSLGYVYHNGSGVEVDYTRAVFWYRKAASQNYSYGQFNMGAMHTNGYGVLKSYSMAIDWYKKAADNFVVESNREMALACLDRINALDPSNPYVEELRISLYGPAKAGVNTDDNLKQKEKGTEGEVEKSEVVEEPAVSTGTAWLASNGCFVTNNHVVEGSDKITLVIGNGKKISAKIVIADTVNDIALLLPGKPWGQFSPFTLLGRKRVRVRI